MTLPEDSGELKQIAMPTAPALGTALFPSGAFSDRLHLVDRNRAVTVATLLAVI